MRHIITATATVMERPSAAWVGSARAEVASATADQAWPFIRDFCNFHRLHPTLDTCRCIGGVEGEPGCMRYCSGENKRRRSVTWAKERIISIDQAARRFRYEVEENNIGFGRAVFEMAVEGRPEGGCQLEWSFVVEPVEGWTREKLLSILQKDLQLIGEKIEKATKTAIFSKL